MEEWFDVPFSAYPHAASKFMHLMRKPLADVLKINLCSLED
jgi:hypothetical protein